VELFGVSVQHEIAEKEEENRERKDDQNAQPRARLIAEAEKRQHVGSRVVATAVVSAGQNLR
jgi:hypothetical protein